MTEAFETEINPYEEAAYSDRDALMFLMKSGIAQKYQTSLEKERDKRRDAPYTERDKKRDQQIHRSVREWYGEKDMKELILDLKTYYERAASADLKMEIGKYHYGDNDPDETTDENIYYVGKLEPNIDDDPISVYGIRSIDMLNGSILDDSDNMGLTHEQIQAAVDYVDARIANKGEPINF